MKPQIALLAAAVALGPLAHAGERALLANGFTMQCDHHAAVDGRLRLYLTAGEANYIDLRPEEVTRFEIAADPAPPAQQTAPSREPSAENLTPAELNEMLDQVGHTHNVDVDLLASVVHAESGGNARAVSHAGARGLMQLMPSTASDLGVNDAFRPGENVRGGTEYLDALLTRYHDNLSLALAAYNAGPAAVDRYHGIPPYHETQVYVARVIREFNRRVRARLAATRSSSPAQYNP